VSRLEQTAAVASDNGVDDDDDDERLTCPEMTKVTAQP